MISETIALPSATPGTQRTLTVQRFGTRGARPCAYLQASLHADEVPAMLVADKLRRILTALEAEGRIKGEVILVPVANPVGLSQWMVGGHIGRFDLDDGKNFNRDYPHLTEAVAERVDGRLTDDPAANTATIRAALADAMAALSPATESERMKHALLALALQADYVLDLHCDHEAVMHLYTLTPSADAFAPLQRLLGAQAVFLAEESGGDPFDEAVSRPWNELAKRWPGTPIPMGCHSVTVELRGQADVQHGPAEADAEAIAGFLIHAGVLAGDPPALPEPLCQPTPLESSEPLVAPTGGVVVFRHKPGDRVEAGAVIADIVDPVTGTVTPVATGSAGILYAHNTSRFTQAGKRVAKVAGTTLRRTGPLLSA